MSRNDIAAMIPPVSVRITAQYIQTGYITSTFNDVRNVSPHPMLEMFYIGSALFCCLQTP